MFNECAGAGSCAPPVLGRSDSPVVGGHLEASKAEGFAQSDQLVLRGTRRILELAHKSNGVSEGRVADSDRYLSREDWVTPEILHAAVGVILLAALVFPAMRSTITASASLGLPAQSRGRAGERRSLQWKRLISACRLRVPGLPTEVGLQPSMLQPLFPGSTLQALSVSELRKRLSL